MNYIDVYFSRINHMGETTAERIRNGGIKSFEKWLSESPHTIRNLSVERGIYFDGIILTSKDKEYEKIMFLEVANNVPLLIGDIMNWTLDDGSIEKWIIIQEEKKVNGTFRSFWIVRCNYLMKWIDAQGHLQQSWAYFVSSLDSKIKGNFRTWNNLITPQPNKYAELLMPRYPIDRATNFIVEEESWTVVEYDHTSVPGVIYLSLTEGKINSIYDDIENNVADLDKKAKYSFIIPDAVPQVFPLGAHIEPFFTIMKNGKPYLNKPEEQEEKARAALSAVGLSESLYEKSPFEISGGEKRRVAIAGVLAMEPEVLILDEPTAGLDPLGKSQILELLKKYQQERHVTVILVSHSMEEVAQYADRVIALHKAKVILDGSTREVFSHRQELEEIGLGVPEVCAFTQSIGLGDTLTVEEAAEKILQMYKL